MSASPRLRIDTGAAAAAATSAVSLSVSAPTSPADELPGGLDTPQGSEISLASSSPLGTKRRRSDDPPMFLEKTYDMLENCAPEIACWSAAGDSFIVKKPLEFAETIIPVYFKHKNFSSFVRQLNFYGFRKVRVDAAELALIDGAMDPKDWWEFRHEKFVHERKELLREIKRRTLSEAKTTVDRNEIDELRAEVAGLRDQIQLLNKHMLTVMQAVAVRSGPSTAPQQAPAILPSHRAPVAMDHTTVAQLSISAPPPQQQYYQPPPTQVQLVGLARSPHLQPFQNSPTALYHLRPLQSVGSDANQQQHVHGMQQSPLPSYQLFASGAGTPQMSHDGSGRRPSPLDWNVAVSTPRQTAFESSQSQRFPIVSSYPGGAATLPSGLASSSHQAADSAAAVAGTIADLSNLMRNNEANANRSVALAEQEESTQRAVRRLSMVAVEIRHALLACINARIMGVLRVPRQETGPKDIDAIAQAVATDIQEQLARVNESGASNSMEGSSPKQQVIVDLETTRMYRIEILKYLSRELPRAVQESVEKRLPASLKKSFDRSLMALLVQKAQAALEAQMRTETSSVPNGL